MTKHTPGPWKAYNRGIGYEVIREDGNPVNDGFRDLFKGPDARLIAAAPELLEALKKLREDWIKTDHRNCDCCLCQADAAIAKAEGVDPANAPATSRNTSVEANKTAPPENIGNSEDFLQ